jgi:predicted methyltransferase
MFYRTFEPLLTNSAEEYDLLAQITQHPSRPRPSREMDQIFMKPGSQLNQVKLIAPLIADKDVVFVGDGDCMALTIGYLAEKGIIDGPTYMRVFDFDHRIVSFVKEVATDLHFADRVEAAWYNVREPPPKKSLRKHDVFYTNPPYGSKNEGFSGVAFLARSMEMCKTVGSTGAAILPFDLYEEWSRLAMRRIQSFMLEHGYVVSEMLTEMHNYHLDDRPRLQSGTVIFHRLEERTADLFGRALRDDELAQFYGSSVSRFPKGIDLNGEIEYDNGS